MTNLRSLVSGLVTLALGALLAVSGCSSESVLCGADECAANEYCRSSSYYTCGYTPRCQVPEQDCNPDLPVCGCDGKVHDSECAARAAGADIGDLDRSAGEICGAALAPVGRFACGPWFCDASSFCSYIKGDDYDRYIECMPLPDACGGVADCACVPVPSSYESGKCQTVQGNGVTGVLVTSVAI